MHDSLTFSWISRQWEFAQYLALKILTGRDWRRSHIYMSALLCKHRKIEHRSHFSPPLRLYFKFVYDMFGWIPQPPLPSPPLSSPLLQVVRFATSTSSRVVYQGGYWAPTQRTLFRNIFNIVDKSFEKVLRLSTKKKDI